MRIGKSYLDAKLKINSFIIYYQQTKLQFICGKQALQKATAVYEMNFGVCSNFHTHLNWLVKCFMHTWGLSVKFQFFLATMVFPPL